MTYSIIARCPETGHLGVAVQSHWFGAGVVCWAKAGVGAVATQAMALIDHGPLGIELMEGGLSSKETLELRLSVDDSPEIRQVAMMDSDFRISVHTGSSTIPESGHIVGDGHSCQANMMWKPTVWGAMSQAFIGTKGDLSMRMLASLQAAEMEGGDIRGQQAARILVVTSEPSKFPWRDTLLDIRVDDHPNPLSELNRLLKLQIEYSELEEFNVQDYFNSEFKTEIPEIAFWKSIRLVDEGMHKEARKISAIALTEHEGWEELLLRCANLGLAGVSDETVRVLLDQDLDE